MNGSRTLSRVPGLVVFCVLFGALALAQSYGPNAQVLTIGAGEFRTEDSGGWLRSADGYLSHVAPSIIESPSHFYYRAALPLPVGARIQAMCMYVHDTDPSNDVGVRLLVTKLTYGGESPAERTIGSVLGSSLAPGYRSYCEDLDQTVTATLDVDDDGTPDPVAWYVLLDLSNTSDDLSFGGAQITWKREVSDPPASPTFFDVPDTHLFYQYIEALAASGVTGGCGDGNFCPAVTLTRGQMAVFLAKALGLHWAD
jgi:hypothetical protein